jgi:lysophospholipase L1-like esterase
MLGPEFEIQRDTRTTRILTIGDSVTFWPAERNYPRVIEERLRESYPQDAIEVLVAAVGGYSSTDALDWYDEFLHRLKPDVAIIHLGWNDMGQFHPFGLRYKNERLAYRERTLVGRMVENLYFLRIFYVVSGRLERSRPVDMSPLTAEEIRILEGFTPTHFKANLEALIGKLKDRGSAVYLAVCAGLITYPPTAEELPRLHFPRGMNKKLGIYQRVYTKYVEIIEQVGASTHTPLIDLRELVRTPDERRIFTDTMHTGAEGAERYGTFMARIIRPKVEEIRMRRAHSSTATAP